MSDDLSEYILERLPDGMCRVRLVPVEIFGAGCDHPAHQGEPEPFGFGLMDAVSAWSDCNRANGRIFRLDEAHNAAYREPGETIEVIVREADVPMFLRDWREVVDGSDEPTLILAEDEKVARSA